MEYVTELKDLLQYGITIPISEKHVGVKFRMSANDAPANSYVLCVKGHNATSGCRKCHVEGSSEDRRMYYDGTNHPKRTEAEFREMSDDTFHHKKSPLVDLPINITVSFPNDSLHLIFLGVSRKWLYGLLFGHTGIKLSAKQIDSLSEVLVSLKPWIPFEYSRRPRSLYEVK